MRTAMRMVSASLQGFGRARLSAFLSQWRREVGAAAAESFFAYLAAMSRYQPYARAHRHGVEVIRDVPYQSSGLSDHLLDIYRPLDTSGPLPIVLYVHGGAFRILSKDTHWPMALTYARHGYLVFNINYRLAPSHPYPAAVQDSCTAFRWLLRNAKVFGGDLDRLVLAGDSAGANLVTSLALSTCYARPEPWARQVFETGVMPHAVVAACGIFQVSDCERFVRNGAAPRWLGDYMTLLQEGYLPQCSDPEELNIDLADPLLHLERGVEPNRPLPPFFLPVGTRDHLREDTQRLAHALINLNADVEAKYYEGGLHEFHAFLWQKRARACWRDTFAFLARRLALTRQPELSELELVASQGVI